MMEKWRGKAGDFFSNHGLQGKEEVANLPTTSQKHVAFLTKFSPETATACCMVFSWLTGTALRGGQGVWMFCEM
jgi:hypothetical protein